MDDLCTDNRFELIEKYKQKLIEETNIESAPDEMKVLDNILFRFWQMGWLDKLEQPSAQQWIPCSERRPEEGEKCLVSDEGRIFIDTYIGYGIPYNWQLYVRDYEAWMPLPESYKGK